MSYLKDQVITSNLSLVLQYCGGVVVGRPTKCKRKETITCRCLDCIIILLLLTDQLYVYTEQNIGEVLFRHTCKLRVTYVSYFEAHFQKHGYHTQRCCLHYQGLVKGIGTSSTVFLWNADGAVHLRGEAIELSGAFFTAFNAHRNDRGSTVRKRRLL